MSKKIMSINSNTSLDLGTGKLEMKNVEINKGFPRIWEGKGKS